MGTSTGKEGIKKNVQRSYICSVMAGHHCCSARAFALKPPRPSGRPPRAPGVAAPPGQNKGPGPPPRAPGVDRSARPSKEACRAIKCRTALARASRNGKEEMLIAKTLLDT